MRLLIVLITILLLTTACSFNSAQQNAKPFLISYELNHIESKHQNVIDPWLQAAKNDSELKMHTYETEDGYKYTYARGYNDVEVSYIYTNDQGQLKQRFIKGSDEDEILVVIKYNTAICCNTNIYETEDHNDTSHIK